MEEAKSLLSESPTNKLKRPKDELLGAFYDTLFEPEFQEQLQGFFQNNLNLFDNKFLSGKDTEHNLRYGSAPWSSHTRLSCTDVAQLYSSIPTILYDL
jgi:hypothetical protein